MFFDKNKQNEYHLVSFPPIENVKEMLIRFGHLLIIDYNFAFSCRTSFIWSTAIFKELFKFGFNSLDLNMYDIAAIYQVHQITHLHGTFVLSFKISFRVECYIIILCFFRSSELKA